MSAPKHSDSQRERHKVHPFWAVFVVLSALAVIVVMVYPFVSGFLRPKAETPSEDLTTAQVSERLAEASPQQRLELIRRYLQSQSPLTRLAAIEAIIDYKIYEGTALLEQAFEDNSSAVRIRAVETLWRQDPDRGRRLLLSALRDDDPWVRRAAVTQLRFAMDRGDVPAVIPLLDDPDMVTRNIAMGLLRRLTGQPFFARITDPPEKREQVRNQWKRWWAQNQHQWTQEKGWLAAHPRNPSRVDPAPRLSLTTLDGQRINLEDYRGKVVLLHFWATWCVPCEFELQQLARLSREVPEDKLIIVGVAVNETDGGKAVREMCRKYGATYPQALATAQVISAYWIQGVPISVLIDPQGRIRYRWEGDRDFHAFNSAVQRLLNEATATAPASTPAGAP